jgi:dipeptidyl-peptidase-4
MIRRALIAALVLCAVPLAAQDRLKKMPGYARAQRVAREALSAVKGGALQARWTDAGAALEYDRDGKHFRYEIGSGKTTEGESDQPAAIHHPPLDGIPDRGRQFTSTTAPDGSLTARYRDRNVWLSAPDGSGERAITTDGSAASRVKYGTASWVYGEELEQRTAMWWSPDSRKLAFYRFDEHLVPDYFLALDQTRLHSTLDVEAYPKAGESNPVVDLFVYDVASARTTRVDVRSGRAFDDDGVGHYVYHVVWSPDGRELLFFRTNRRQNVMELAAANVETGATRVVLREEWPGGWINEDPRIVFLQDGHRFVWESQRNGWNNFYLYDLSGRLIAPITQSSTFEAVSLVKIDEYAGVVFYTARDGDNILKPQLHRVKLDGSDDRRLTDPAFHHTIGNCIPTLGLRFGQLPSSLPCGISPDNARIVDIYQTHDTPPATRLIDGASGKVVAELAKSDTSGFTALGLRKAELFSYRAADGSTTLHGLIEFPSSFDPAMKYPLLVSVYGGPEFADNAARETFVTPSAITEYGFLVAHLDSRSVPGLGKRTLDAVYRRLGQVEVDDMAEGVKALWSREYVDRMRVGIFGTSYGGYASLMALVRHPEVFAAASASSPVTDWRNYDTVYTERYMSTPQDNADGYDAGSAVVHAGDAKGRLLLYYGTQDNNVHPGNSLQLIRAFEDAGKSLDVQVGPDRAHSAVNQDRMMEFFLDAFGMTVGQIR